MSGSRGAVLFDIDGTLVDSNYLHVAAWMRAFDEVGHPVDGVRIHRAIGMGSPQLLSALLGDELAERLGDPVKEAHSVRYRATFDLLRPFDGACELVRAVSRRAAAVLATSASPEELEQLRRTLDLDDALTAVTSADDVAAAKPEPDLVEVALERIGVSAERAIFVGDTIWDVKASRRAGVGCVGLCSGGISATELREAGAIAVYADASSLLAGLEQSPLADVFSGEPRPET
ncbi:MAG: HAD family hydrolase [Acidimicrobiales bacterium]